MADSRPTSSSPHFRGPRKSAPRKLSAAKLRKLRTLQMAWDALHDVMRQHRDDTTLRQDCRNTQITLDMAERRLRRRA